MFIRAHFEQEKPRDKLEDGDKVKIKAAVQEAQDVDNASPQLVVELMQRHRGWDFLPGRWI